MSIHPAPHVVVADRFRLNRLLGRGGMGSVWHATHLGLDVPCALKFIEGEGAHLPEVQARFEREAKAAAKLRSPHVVQILDHGVCEGTPYIAMELLDGEDFGKRLARVGRLAPQDLLPIVTQVCRALAKAHAVGIVHRDLKPDNIFLVHDDDREIAKVLDFGIAKATGAGAPGSSTRTGTMMGTPYYMSPEQAQGTKAVDARSDLWSLAVIVFEALAGQRPFESEALGDLLMKIIIAPIAVPSHVARDLPPGFDAWWARASQRDAALRYQSAKELCDGLAIALGRSIGDVGESRPLPIAAPPRKEMESLVHGSTGDPIARTFAVRPPGAKSRTAIVFAIVGSAALLGAGIVGVSYGVKGKLGRPATASMGSVMPAADAMVAAEPPATRIAAIAPLPVASSAPVLAVVPPPPAARQAPVKPPQPLRAQPAVGLPAAAIVPPPTKPPTAPPAPTENKKKTIDLGI